MTATVSSGSNFCDTSVPRTGCSCCDSSSPPALTLREESKNTPPYQKKKKTGTLTVSIYDPQDTTTSIKTKHIHNHIRIQSRKCYKNWENTNRTSSFSCCYSSSFSPPSSSSSSSGTEVPLVFESFGLLNDIFPFPSIPDAGYPIFNLHLANVLFDVILPSILWSSMWSFG